MLEEVDWFIECKNTVRMSKTLSRALERAEKESHGASSVVHIKMPGTQKSKVVVDENLWMYAVELIIKEKSK